MSLKSFIQRFLLHCLWALTMVVVVMFGMEFLIPGSVTPYADPLPWAVLALVGLSVDAMIRPVAPRRWLRMGMGMLVLILSLLAISSGITAWGKSTVMLVLVSAAMLGLTGWFGSGKTSG